MGLVKFIKQIRTKIVEDTSSHHFWSIACQCPCQDSAITPIPDQDSGQLRHPNHLKVSPSSQGRAQLSVHSVTNHIILQLVTIHVPALSCHCPLTKKRVLTEHLDVSQGLQKFPGPPVRLHLKEGYKAALRGICKVPVHMEKEFVKDVENMVNQGIIRQMRDYKHSEWANSYVQVTKKAPHGMPRNMVSAEKVRRKIFQPKGRGYVYIPGN